MDYRSHAPQSPLQPNQMLLFFLLFVPPRQWSQAAAVSSRKSLPLAPANHSLAPRRFPANGGAAA